MARASTVPRILIIAGSDSGGGAGVQADIKTVMALGGYAGTAITALTAQNTQGVAGIYPVPSSFVALQMTTFLEDIGADAIKTGMLFSADSIHEVADSLEREAAAIPLVVDPVMVAKGGARLLEDRAQAALIRRLIPMARLVTPNMPEAEVLSRIPVHDLASMKRAGEMILEKGAQAVLIKGGHGKGKTLYDVLITGDGMDVFESRRIQTAHTHGTGCTLASAIAVLMLQKPTLRDAVAAAREYVREAMLAAPGLGHGHGPLGHGWGVTSRCMAPGELP